MMNQTAHPPFLDQPRARVERGFSLIEIMVAVALLSVIIIGLVAMFNQTRRAFTSSLAQVDVLEAGRATAELISRDVSQMAPCYYPNADFTVPNFYVITSNYNNPLITQLANPADKWTNLIQQLFFLTPSPVNGQQWTAIGYRLQLDGETNSVGTLYRYYATGLTTTNSTNLLNLTRQLTSFFNLPNLTNNYNRIIDGVTHFRILAYQRDGTIFLPVTNNLQVVLNSSRYPNWEYAYEFFSNTVPAYVEVELGILETQAYERYRALVPGSPAANSYLTNHPGVVHLFRQRIPVRNVDPSAYQ